MQFYEVRPVQSPLTKCLHGIYGSSEYPTCATCNEVLVNTIKVAYPSLVTEHFKGPKDVVTKYRF
jgi:hypothetical protein